MIDFGIVKPGTTLYIPFATYDSNDPSASVTLTGLATTDIEVYKDGSVTQRASDAGFALLDTDGIDFDGTTGIHGFSIDLADNTTAGFYAAGSQYFVIVASVTVDAATINFIAARFTIGYPSALLNTTIATLASQTSFTLTVGPAEDDALNGMEVMIHDVASAVQCGRAVILDYTGSTKTVTLAAGTTFTAAATDNIAIIGPSPLMPVTAGRQAVVDANGLVDANTVKAGASGSGVAWGSGAITAAAIADGAIDAATFAADVDAEIATMVWNAATASYGSAGSYGLAVEDILTDTAEIGAAGAGLTNINLPNQTMDITGNITGNLSGSVGSVTGAVGSVTGAVGSVTGLTASDVGAIKTKTDSLTFTQAGHVDANIQRINDVAITGDGSATPFNV